MAWLQHSKVYDRTTKRWFCSLCDKRTPIEVNTEWDTDGRPMEWEGKSYEWITRCARCHHKHSICEYWCPRCGSHHWNTIEVGKMEFDWRAAYEYGVEGYNWDELCQCVKCRHKFWIRNGNC